MRKKSMTNTTRALTIKVNHDRKRHEIHVERCNVTGEEHVGRCFRLKRMYD